MYLFGFGATLPLLHRYEKVNVFVLVYFRRFILLFYLTHPFFLTT
ncbi:hypothetical protein AVDCRST_MAG94-4097 [uncultured Leptolyngbya sp.]|uniref:Uncharacterized protein n=1 Tax=uncultured Leptolyngbya sp. TaxID=332963 RepID=A0A6J4MVN3_9CYAN|nr:hypothetical protein AVDCRST_MAG94-4097 [uncultured Leptolyngbya sp.]